MTKKRKPKKMVPLRNVLIVAGVAIALIAGIGMGVVKDMLFYPPAPKADYPEPANETEARLQDLDYFEKYVRGYDRSYSFRARGKALKMISEAKAMAGELSLADLDLFVSEVVALGENGHSNAWSGSRARRHPGLPLHGYWFDDGFFIVSTSPDYADLVGAQLTHIGTSTVEELFDAFRVYYGGEDSGYRAYNSTLLMENTAFLNILGAIESTDSADLRLVMPDGESRTLTVNAIQPSADRTIHWGWRWLLAENEDSEDDWARLGDNHQNLPLYLSESAEAFQLKFLDDVKVLYVHYRQNNDANGHSISSFNGRIRDAVAEYQPEIFILDERHNGGGDYTTTAGLMFDLPGLLPEGARIYAITGHETFSAAISSLGFLKQAAGDQMTIVGRRIGDSPLSWGETNEFILPNSGIGMTAARGLHDQLNGCYDWVQCYWTDFDYPTAVGSLDPDVPVPFTFADYSVGRDAALDKILELEGVK